MDPIASTAIALGSLGLAALTVLVSYLNVRRQSDLAMQAEHVRWLRDKRDQVYGQMLDLLSMHSGLDLPSVSDRWWVEFDEVGRVARRYASDAVLENWDAVSKSYVVVLKQKQGDESIAGERLPLAAELRAVAGLMRQVREELAGHAEAAKTWRRYDSR